MSINWREIGWWVMAVVLIVHVFAAGNRIINHANTVSERPAITQQ
jgi:Ni,Fe-hydrogenase I cytochrome b subunit